MNGLFQLLEALLTQSLLVLFIEALFGHVICHRVLDISLHDRLFHFLVAHIHESLLYVVLHDDITDVTSLYRPAHRLGEYELLLGFGHFSKVETGNESDESWFKLILPIALHDPLQLLGVVFVFLSCPFGHVLGLLVLIERYFQCAAEGVDTLQGLPVLLVCLEEGRIEWEVYVGLDALVLNEWVHSALLQPSQAGL